MMWCVVIIKYVSWDPGGARKKRTTGMTKWDEEGNPRDVQEFNEAELNEALTAMEDSVEEFIIERYLPRPGISHTGNKLLTAQAIGNLKGFARRNNIKVVEQNSNILRIAAMNARVTIPKGHMPDRMSSYLHGYYYLLHKGVIRAKVLDD